MSPRTDDQNQKIKDERREQILQAAQRLFARNGLASVKMTDLAAAAGTSQGLLYHYFPSKEALLAAVVERAMRKASRISSTALEQPGTPWDRIQYLCQEMIAATRTDPENALISIQALTSDTMREAARSLLQQYGFQTFMNVLTLIRQGQEAGQVVSGDAVELTLAYLAMLQGLTLIRLQGDAVIAAFPSADTVLRMLKA